MNTLIKKFKQEPDEFEIIYRYPEKENIDGPFVQSVNIDDYIRSIRGEDYIEPKIESDVKPKLEPGVNLNEESIESVPTKSTQSPIKEKVHTRYECYKCHLSVSSLENLKIHRCFIELQCDVCAKKFTDKQKLYSHKKWHTRSAIKQRHECNLCKKTFTAISSLNSHIANVHDGQRPFECKICKKRCAKKVDLKKHELSHTGEKPHQCDVCNMKFSLFENMKRHKRGHIERPYHCDFCPKRFPEKISLDIHRRVHTREKIFQCYDCKKTFLENGQLKAHLKIHFKSKSYSCSLCKERFSELSDLKLHKTSHERSYECNLCKKRFFTKIELSRHQKTHSSQRLYECAECGQKFKTSGALRRHVKCHSGEKLFKCDLCSSKFLRSDSLKDHRKRHTADRQFGCDLCSKRFFDNKGLQRHKLSHTKEKPYKCQFCKKKFSAQFCCILHTRGKHFDLLRQQDKLSGTLNVLFQGMRTYECYKCQFTSLLCYVKKHMKTCAFGEKKPLRKNSSTKKKTLRNMEPINKFQSKEIQC